MNIEGMSPYENETADYIKATDNHVLYRVTPVFEGNNLLSYGVLMEGESVEDEGEEVEFCVFCYNVEPGITIDYSDGSSEGEEYKGTSRSVPDGSAVHPKAWERKPRSRFSRRGRRLFPPPLLYHPQTAVQRRTRLPTSGMQIR